MRTVEADTSPLERAQQLELALDRYGTAIFRNVPLEQALYSLSLQWQVGIVADPQLVGKATGIFRRATLREILDAILSENGYVYRRSEGTLVIERQDRVPAPVVVSRPVDASQWHPLLPRQ